MNKNVERELLTEMRRQMAKKRGFGPCRVFRDTELEDLLKYRPKSISELEKIKGFPTNGARVKGYGQAIISIFNNSNDVKGFDVSVSGDDFKVVAKLSQMQLF